MRNLRSISALIVGITGLALAGLAYYLGWKGIPLSAVGFGVAATVVLLAFLEWSAYWLADNNHNAWCPVPATLAGAGIVGFIAWLAPIIGWLAAGATVLLVVIWVSSVMAALLIRD